MTENITYKVGERIDSFSFTEFKQSLETNLAQSPAILTLDLQGTKFLSIPAIKLIAFCADQMLNKGGRVILLGPTEKLKRQIGIYGSLKNVMIKKSEKAPEEQPSVGLPVHDEIPGF